MRVSSRVQSDYLTLNLSALQGATRQSAFGATILPKGLVHGLDRPCSCYRVLHSLTLTGPTIRFDAVRSDMPGPGIEVAFPYERALPVCSM